jgi:hypothetical protein
MFQTFGISNEILEQMKHLKINDFIKFKEVYLIESNQVLMTM